MAVLNDLVHWNNFGIGQLLPHRATDMKHLRVVVVHLNGLEPVDVDKWVRVITKVQW